MKFQETCEKCENDSFSIEKDLCAGVLIITATCKNCGHQLELINSDDYKNNE